MSVFRVNANKGYTVMSNHHLRDKNLSLKAKGLLSYMLSLPEDWDYSIAGLAAVNKEGIKAIRSTLRELELAGYLKRTRVQQSNGYFDYVYDIFETPDLFSGSTQRHDQAPHAQNRHAGKGTQINTNKQITDYQLLKPNTLVATKVATPVSREAEALARKLHDLILENKPDRKIDKNWFRNWSVEIDKMHRLDGRKWEKIDKIIDWCQKNSFWQRNILSGRTLREKYDRLDDDMGWEAGATINLDEV